MIAERYETVVFWYQDKSLETDWVFVCREVLLMCNHPFITDLYFAFQTERHLYLVLEYCRFDSVVLVSDCDLLFNPSLGLPAEGISAPWWSGLGDH